MSNENMLNGMLQAVDAPAGRLAVLDAYYAGAQPMAFLAPEARTSLGSRMDRMAVNIPRLAVTALAERLRVIGFVRGGKPDAQLWADWIANDLDQLAAIAHREALALGSSYVVVWADGAGAPKVSIESAHQMAVSRDPGTRRITAAIKRWTAGNETHAVLYEADRITRYHANSAGAVSFGQFTAVEVLSNPLGVVPVVALKNTDRLLGEGTSEMADLLPLVDALNKITADMMVSSEFFARPRRWATGLELAEDEDGNPVNPIGEDHRMMISEAPETKFGQLEAADLGSYESATRVILGHIMAVSALPAHYLGALAAGMVTSADSMRAAEASLAARADARRAVFGRDWEDVARLMVAVREGVDPLTVDVRVKWADTTTRSVGQEADAAVKLHAAGILPTSTVLARLGYSDDEITSIRAARRTDALDVAGTDLAGLLS